LQAKLALRTNETPVGCVVVHDNKVIARGMNATNVTRNGTRHAEFMALAALLSRVDGSILRESTLYVTVEPCVMCASLLRQVGIKKVYFGAVNDKFGGTGGVFSIHANSTPGQTACAHPQPKSGGGSLGTSFPPGGGDGGNIERGFEIEGGWGRDEAVALLRRFYVQENGRGNVPPSPVYCYIATPATIC
ncbi:uncharacterized protein TRIVIDRAFT_27743, partial [Trichoderma virens Gv29-8]